MLGSRLAPPGSERCVDGGSAFLRVAFLGPSRALEVPALMPRSSKGKPQANQRQTSGKPSGKPLANLPLDGR